MNRFGIIANRRRPDAAETIERIHRWANDHGWTVTLEEGLATDPNSGAITIPAEKLRDTVDLVIALGGDGTMLSATRSAAPLTIPVLGINLGSLGFLTELTPADLDRTLDRISQGDYVIETRMLLDSQVSGDCGVPPIALNDVVIDKGGVARLIHLDLYVNDEFISSYSADGLIVATPTGSTAYALASGGPIIHPRIKAIIVAPIAPHTLAQRPMVFSEDDSLRIVVASPRREASLTIDGQVACSLHNNDSVTIAKSGIEGRFIRFPENSFYRVLRDKLNWGFKPAANSRRRQSP